MVEADSMNPMWTTPVTIPSSGITITNSSTAETYLRRHWAALPERERAALHRRLISARAGQTSHAAVRSAFVDLIRTTLQRDVSPPRQQ